MPLTRGRVIPAENLSQTQVPTKPYAQVVTAASPLSKGHVIAREVVDAHQRAEAIVQKARTEAACLLETAHQAAALCREQAQREGREEGAAELAAFWVLTRQAQAERLCASEEQVIEVARILAERLLRCALDLEPAVIVCLARETLTTVLRARRIDLFVHPEDAEPLRAHTHELGFDAALVEIHLDPSRTRGSLRAQTDLGTLDAELGLQLDRLVAALRRPPAV